MTTPMQNKSSIVGSSVLLNIRISEEEIKRSEEIDQRNSAIMSAAPTTQIPSEKILNEKKMKQGQDVIQALQKVSIDAVLQDQHRDSLMNSNRKSNSKALIRQNHQSTVASV